MRALGLLVLIAFIGCPEEPQKMTRDEAIAIAREAIEGKVVPSAGGSVAVQETNGTFVVTFGRNDPPGTRGPDYDARVTIDAKTGKAIEVLGGP